MDLFICPPHPNPPMVQKEWFRFSLTHFTDTPWRGRRGRETNREHGLRNLHPSWTCTMGFWFLLPVRNKLPHHVMLLSNFLAKTRVLGDWTSQLHVEATDDNVTNEVSARKHVKGGSGGKQVNYGKLRKTCKQCQRPKRWLAQKQVQRDFREI